ncbi:MAG: hypothetical protein KDK91_32585 [Gammaproteobacteria bacterium]|nr:hypothetical protein [Gammaproteobacteria bacterium]
MSEIAIDQFARRLYEEYGAKAMSVAAHRAAEYEEKGDAEQARTWRRVEEVLSQMRGPPES